MSFVIFVGRIQKMAEMAEKAPMLQNDKKKCRAKSMFEAKRVSEIGSGQMGSLWMRFWGSEGPQKVFLQLLKDRRWGLSLQKKIQNNKKLPKKKIDV